MDELVETMNQNISKSDEPVDIDRQSFRLNEERILNKNMISMSIN